MRVCPLHFRRSLAICSLSCWPDSATYERPSCRGALGSCAGPFGRGQRRCPPARWGDLLPEKDAALPLAKSRGLVPRDVAGS